MTDNGLTFSHNHPAAMVTPSTGNLRACLPATECRLVERCLTLQPQARAAARLSMSHMGLGFNGRTATVVPSQCAGCRRVLVVFALTASVGL
jgi:hypothetical protein